MLARLLPFLDDVDPSVRLFAALGCLRIAAAKAAATLEEIGATAISTIAPSRWKISTAGATATASSTAVRAGGWRASAPCATKTSADVGRPSPRAGAFDVRTAAPPPGRPRRATRADPPPAARPDRQSRAAGLAANAIPFLLDAEVGTVRPPARPCRARQRPVARIAGGGRDAGRVPGRRPLRLAVVVRDQARDRQSRADLELRDGPGARQSASCRGRGLAARPDRRVTCSHEGDPAARRCGAADECLDLARRGRR